jgi:hypothetical protein
MAIIKPTKKFQGSEIDLREIGKYIKPDVRQVTFSKRQNPNGTYLYFLPSYKEDHEGNGVWYKPIRVRDNFGDKFKQKYLVIPNDPVTHFERNLKLLYSELAATKDVTDDKGQSRKVYPLCGRVANRVVYNVAYFDKLDAGPHVLDLPAFNGAIIFDNWQKEKDTRGRERPLLCDPEHCIPVFIKLRDGGGMPWQIEPSPAEAAVLPDSLADSDNLYNLDEIFIEKTPEELIANLRELYSPEVFERCMEGYTGFQSNTEQSSPVNRARPVLGARGSGGISSAIAGAIKNIPRAPVENVEKEYLDEEDDDLDMTPVQSPKVVVPNEQAQAFLKRPKPRIGG